MGENAKTRKHITMAALTVRDEKVAEVAETEVPIASIIEASYWKSIVTPDAR